MDPESKPLLAARRPAGIPDRSRLARIMAKLDGVRVRYRFWIGAGSRHELAGVGRLQVRPAAGQLWCRVAGELHRPSPVEYAFHSFWLTRRGQILLVASLLDHRAPPARAASIQPVAVHDRALQAAAAQWRQRTESPAAPAP
jgi:hypothetical protein